MNKYRTSTTIVVDGVNLRLLKEQRIALDRAIDVRRAHQICKLDNRKGSSYESSYKWMLWWF
jgi:hypothetical protein